jgi:APA family basic amino acid/polyamine antiporter
MQNLKRSIHTPGAIFMGLGSILGTGLFVSLAYATQIAGEAVILAIVLAAILAALNGLSSAQLAATHPVSGGTYEYAYREVGPYAGFAAGWMFLVAKTASAATAAMGSVAYIDYTLAIGLSSVGKTLGALGILGLFTALISGGIQRSNRVNTGIVLTTLTGLAVLVGASVWVLSEGGVPMRSLQIWPVFGEIAGDVQRFAGGSGELSGSLDGIGQSGVDSGESGGTPWSSLLFATALMFVAYTGYGRIATLGEEVVNPRKTIPRAIIFSMVVIVVIYISVATVALLVMGAGPFGQTIGGNAAPLLAVARTLSMPSVSVVVSIAAITAMLGVLLNLLLGISRVLLAMARRGDMPQQLTRVHAASQSPVPAVLTTGGIIALFVLSGDLTFTWSLSAFTVLIYYSLTNLSALRMDAPKRLYPIFVPIGGLFGCLFLAVWIEPRAWIPGVILLAVGLLIKFVLVRRSSV